MPVPAARSMHRCMRGAALIHRLFVLPDMMPQDCKSNHVREIDGAVVQSRFDLHFTANFIPN